MLLMRAAAAVQSAAPTQEEGAAEGCPRNAACTLALTLTVLQWTPRPDMGRTVISAVPSMFDQIDFRRAGS